jgi:hypothetical protein
MFVHPEGNFNNNPHLYAVIGRLCEEGYSVTIQATRRNFSQQAPHPGTEVVLHGRFISKILSLLSRFRLGRIPSLLICTVLYRRSNPDLIIGVDAAGIVIASLLARLKGCSIALFSYELFFESEIGKFRKRSEIEACRELEFAVVQDPPRGDQLARENQIECSKMIYMPVAAAKSREASGGWLRSKLKIPKSKKIAVCMGSLTEWSGFDRLLTDLDRWPEDWCLVAHHRYGFSDSIATKLQKKHPDTLFLSTESFETNEDLGRLLGDADIGIAFYCPDYRSEYTGLNLYYIGLASGKISTFLEFGVPVLVNQIGDMADDVRAEQLGFVVESVEATPSSFKTIPAKDLAAVNRCQTYFDRVLSVNATIAPLLSKIELITR